MQIHIESFLILTVDNIDSGDPDSMQALQDIILFQTQLKTSSMSHLILTPFRLNSVHFHLFHMKTPNLKDRDDTGLALPTSSQVTTKKKGT